MKSHLTRFLTGTALVFISIAGKAAVLITAQNDVNGTFSVSSSDLGQAAGTTLTLDSGAADFGSDVSKLNNGIIYDGLGNQSTIETLTPADGSVATFHFDLGASAGGYALTSIISLTGTGQGRARQVFDVSYSLVGESGFHALASVTSGLAGNDTTGETQVTLANLGVSGVDELRFTFHGTGINESMYREIDVSGTTVPEPSQCAGATGLALLAFTAWRRVRR